MSYSRFVKTKVDMAFKLIGDLAKDVVLSSGVPGDFNFATNTGTVVSARTFTTRAVVVKSTAKSPIANSAIKRLILPANAIELVESFDTVTWEGKSWKIIPEVSDDGYLKYIDVYRVNNG